MQARLSHPRGRPFRLLPAAPLGVLLILCLGIGAAILWLNQGRFLYTMDDAYIHLALAENLAHGHYGVNPGELSAPASSILWPLLLVPAARAGMEEAMPLVLNIAASLLTLVLYWTVVGWALAGAPAERRTGATALIVTLLIPATNLIGLAFMGMEHSLQLLLATAVVAGLVMERQTRCVPWWLVVAMIAGPLVRYEALALSLPALVYLAWRGHGRLAALSGLALAAGLAAFSLLLDNAGLGWLPTSVLAKSRFAAGGITGVVAQLTASLGYAAPRQVLLLLLTLILLLGSALFTRRPGDRGLALWAMTAITLHLAFGTYSVRHDTYIVVTGLLVILTLYSEPLSRLVTERSLWLIALLGGAAVILLAGPYLSRLVRTPLAANNLYEQQYQMHRFVAEYWQAPVAVNDLGLVSYRNDQYVLDLIGLASRPVLDARRHSQGDSSWMAELAGEYDVHAAMLYEPWYPSLPETWIPVADLSLSRPNVTTGGDVVTFYALDEDSLVRMRPLLALFRDSLPAGVTFVWRQG